MSRMVQGSIVTLVFLNMLAVPSRCIAQSCTTSVPSVAPVYNIAGQPIGQTDLTWFFTASAPSSGYALFGEAGFWIDYYATRADFDNRTNPTHTTFITNVLPFSGPISWHSNGYNESGQRSGRWNWLSTVNDNAHDGDGFARIQ